MRINLRLFLRVLAITAFTTVVVYSFGQSSTAYKNINKHLEAFNAKYGSISKIGSAYNKPATNVITATNTTNETPSVDTVENLWATWSKAFEDARPKASEIRLGSNAGNIPVYEDPDSPRSPSVQHVLNDESDIQALHTAHTAFLESLKSWPQDAAKDVYKGTGVVTVGGGEYFGPAIIGIHMLRRSGSDLPVEVFVPDKSEYETQICDEYLPKLGAKCMIIADYVSGFKVTHYQLKSLAMLLSSFAEVLYLDSDSMALVNPTTELFATEPYTSTGLVIWPDFWIASESPSFYQVIGFQEMPSNLPQTSSEAGQLLIDKRKHLKTLLLANYYNIYGPDYYYPLLSQGALGQGDKETFMAAAMVLDNPYHRVHHPVESVGRNDGYRDKGSGMIQFHPTDDLHHETDTSIHIRPAFVHANTPKMNAGHLVDEGDLFTAKDHNRLRLWGDEKDQIKRFGLDLEKAVWELVVQTGCELENVVREWKDRKDMCERLEAHWEEMFGDDEEKSRGDSA